MIKYKTHLREGATEDEAREAATQVVGHLSMCASATDDPFEFADKVEVTTYPSRQGGMYVCGALDREPVNKHLDREVPRSEFEIPGAQPAGRQEV